MFQFVSKKSNLTELKFNKIMEIIRESSFSFNSVDLLISWGFEFFKLLQQYSGSDDFEVVLNRVISGEEYELIQKAMLNYESSFSEIEVFLLFKLADTFLATGKARERILSIFIQYLSDNEAEIIAEYSFLCFWKEFLETNEFGIRRISQGIGIAGFEVNANENSKNYTLLSNLIKCYNDFYIENIPLNSEDIERIQSVLHRKLTGIYFKDCPFNFENFFDFSHLNSLTHFCCNNCFADNHIK